MVIDLKYDSTNYVKREASGLTPIGDNSFSVIVGMFKRIIINFHSKNILRNVLFRWW